MPYCVREVRERGERGRKGKEGRREGDRVRKRAILCQVNSFQAVNIQYGGHFAHTPSASHMDWRKVDPHTVHEDGKTLPFHVSEALGPWHTWAHMHSTPSLRSLSTPVDLPLEDCSLSLQPTQEHIHVRVTRLSSVRSAERQPITSCYVHMRQILHDTLPK